MMGRSRTDFPYEELGLLLQRWRRKDFRSALALFKDRGFSFSYSAYADFERGSTLPSPGVLLEIAQSFAQDPTEALFVWARVQMPTKESRALFSSRQAEATLDREEKTKIPEVGPAPTFENTWVFGEQDRKIIEEHFWLLDLCFGLGPSYPQEVPFHGLFFPRTISQGELVNIILRRWVEAGRIVPTETGLRLQQRHIHIPNTPDWHDFRLTNLKRVLGRVLENTAFGMIEEGLAYREIVTRTFTRTQLMVWVNRLRSLEREIKQEIADPKSSEPKQTYSLISAFGPRSYR